MGGWSRAEEVSGGSDNDYSLYVDIVYQDGTPLWGQTGNFRTGTHDWERREFVIAPEKPIRTLTLYCIFRGHSGRAWFDDVTVSEAFAPAGSLLFQGTPMTIVPWTDPSPIVPVSYTTGDGLKLTLEGERVASLELDGRVLGTNAATWWMPMSPELPRTEEMALQVRDDYAEGPEGHSQRIALVSRSAADP